MNGSAAGNGTNGNNNSTSSAKIEQLNSMREALFSQDGWGGVSIEYNKIKITNVHYKYNNIINFFCFNSNMLIKTLIGMSPVHLNLVQKLNRQQQEDLLHGNPMLIMVLSLELICGKLI